MTIMKSILAVVIVAFSAEVSAQVAFMPNFPIDEQTQTQMDNATSTEHVAQETSAPAKNAA